MLKICLRFFVLEKGNFFISKIEKKVKKNLKAILSVLKISILYPAI